jgi:branched-chain amino acid transport system permease protein
MLGLMVSLTLLVDLGLTKTFQGWELVIYLPLIVLGTMVITGLINVAVDRIAYRPLRRAPRLVPLISAIGVSFMLENLTLVIKGPYVLSYPDVIPSIDIVQDVLHIDSAVIITTKDLLVIGVTIPLIFALHLFVTRTYWGKAMRAAAQDRETAESMGIDVERVIILTFFVGGALAGAAGVVQGIYYNIGQWWMGYQAGLRAFTAAVLGGIGNMPGAALGGFAIGILSAWSDQLISARWTNAIVFSVLILVLVFRPHGLLGERVPEKH